MADYLISTQRYIHRFGTRIVENWRKDPNKWPREDCMWYTYRLARQAMQQLGGAPLPRYSKRYAVVALWGSHIDVGKKKWLTLPEEWRARGGPGAMMYEGRGTKIYENADIFAGALEPGAIIQGWLTFSDYMSVWNGDPIKPNHGHSFYFREYVRGGMKVIDAGFHRDRVVTRSAWGYMIATNLRCIGHPMTEPMPWPAGDQATGIESGKLRAICPVRKRPNVVRSLRASKGNTSKRSPEALLGHSDGV